MGYQTPNIDRIARRGRAVHGLVRPAELHRRSRLVHHRAAADPHRAHQGGHAGRHEDPEKRGSDVPELLKSQGYATGQFGKNHLGDQIDICRRSMALMSGSAIYTT